MCFQEDPRNHLRMGGAGKAAGETASLMATHRARVLHRLARLGPKERQALHEALAATVLDGVSIDYSGLLGPSSSPRGGAVGLSALFRAIGSVGMNALDRSCLAGHWRHDALPRLARRMASPTPPLSPGEASAVESLERRGYVRLPQVLTALILILILIPSLSLILSLGLGLSLRLTVSPDPNPNPNRNPDPNSNPNPNPNLYGGPTPEKAAVPSRTESTWWCRR